MTSFVAGVSKNLWQGNETGRGAKKNRLTRRNRHWDGVLKIMSRGRGEAKWRRMAFSFSKCIFTFYGYSCFCIIEMEIDDVINSSFPRLKCWIKNISRNIGTVFFKLGTWNVQRKRNRMTPTMVVPWQHCRLESLSMKKLWTHMVAILF